jgi:signal transduction histidine kinase
MLFFVTVLGKEYFIWRFMSIADAIYILIAAVNIAIGFFVLNRNKRLAINRSFFSMTLFISLWILSLLPINVLDSSSANQNVLNLVARLPFALIVVFIGSFLIFSYLFPKNLHLSFKGSASIIVATLLIFLISLSPLVISEMGFENGAPVPVLGDAFLLFPIFLLIASFLSLKELMHKYKVLSGVYRFQLRLFAFGLFIFLIGASVTNLILSILFNFSGTFILGPVFVLIFIGSLAYAIIRYRFMDIRLILARSVLYVLLISIVSALGTVGTIYLGDFLAEQYGISRFVTVVISSILIVAFIDPTKRLFTRLTESIFYKSRIDYQALIRDMSEILNEEIELPKLVGHYTKTFQQKMKLKRADLWLPVDEDIYMRAESSEDAAHQGADSLTRQTVVRELNRTKKPIILEEYEYLLADTSDPEEHSRLQDVIDGVNGMKASFLLPVMNKEHIAGILALGGKRSGESFSNDDIEFLMVIAPQLGAALEKARLYEDVKEFNVKLEHEIKNATTELRDANDKLKELDKAKSEFMSIASHQLRTPLAGISGYLSMIMDGDYGETAQEQEPILRDILNASQRLSRIVNVFLNVTRIEAGRFVMNFTSAPFHVVIEDIYKELKPTASKKGVKLTLEKTELPEVEADIDKVKDVILNLVDNAIKYTPEGAVTIRSEANKRTVHVMVQDTGVGIEPEEAKNLFSKFVRGSGIAQVQPDGSGLGLYIAKRVVEGHGGKIWVESEGEGKGSTFHFEIPIKADKDSKAHTKEFQDRAKAK